MFDTRTIKELSASYPNIDDSVIEEIYLAGKNNYKSHVNDKILDCLRRSKNNKFVFELMMEIFADDIVILR